MDKKGAQAMLSAAGYSQRAIEYYLHKPHLGLLKDADLVSELNGTCGDTMKISLKVENNIIKDAKYEVLGCPGAVASAMAAVELIKGKSLEQAKAINDGDIFKKLIDIPSQKHHCIQLSVNTLHKAINEYKGNS